MNFIDLIQLAEHCEDLASKLDPTEENLQRHAELMDRSTAARNAARAIVRERMKLQAAGCKFCEDDNQAQCGHETK